MSKVRSSPRNLGRAVHPVPVQRTTELPGRTTAVTISDVRPQITGVILRRLFTEGSDVKEGQQLYEIDPRLYKASLDQAMAQRAPGPGAGGSRPAGPEPLSAA